MAKQQHGINDGYRGSVGTVIGYQWRGIWCLRAKPRRVHNPRTPLQQLGRSVFGATSTLAAGFAESVRLGLQVESRQRGMAARNLFISLNRHCVAVADGVATVDFSSLVVAAGPVAPVAFGSPSRSGEGGREVSVPFERNPLHLRSDTTDEVYLFAFCPQEGKGYISEPSFRCGRRASIVLPQGWQGLEVHLYGFVMDYSGRASASSYIGMLSADEVEEELPAAPAACRPLVFVSASLPALPSANEAAVPTPSPAPQPPLQSVPVENVNYCKRE